MKCCTYCKQEKDLTDFYFRRGKPRSECKECTKRVNKETITKDASLRAKRNYRSRNRETLRQKHSEYKKENRATCNASWMVYYAGKKNATPSWLSDSHHKDMRAMYTLAKKFECVFGVVYHVDHIVPLKGENVCGLHVPWNLQLLPANLTISKNNKYNDFTDAV